jgi:hypothetical protein
MLPVLNISSSYSAPATLVATVIPDTNTLRVAPSTIAPAVSAVQIDPNTTPSPNITPPAPVTQTQTAADTAAVISANNAAQATAGSPSQAEFLAQLVSQEIPPVLRDTYKTVLAQYEVAVANSFVQYKPSDAGIPPITPADSFQDVLAAETAAPQVQPVTPAVTAQTTAAPVVEDTAAAPRSIAVSSSPLQSRASSFNTSGTTQLDSTAFTLPAPVAINAYAATVARNAANLPAIST